jgi:phosphoglycerate dehydrogenase-like enzyme
MPLEDVSRRKFLRNVAAGSTGAALATMSSPLSAHEGGAVVAAGGPVTMESYPLVEPGKAAAVTSLKIVTRDGIPNPTEEYIRGLSNAVTVKTSASDGEFRRELADADALFGGFSREDFAAARQLKWIQYTAAGVEGILWPEVVESPVVLTNMQRMYSPTISESAIGLLLTLTRGLNKYALQTRERTWQPVEGLREISGMTMGLVGMGGIGTDTAYRAHYGFHMKILAVDPKPLPRPAFVAELHSLDWLPKMVPQVDVLMSAAPHTHLSEGMFNESIFRAMKPSAYFINVSRGKLVDTPALVRALKEGWIAGAALDVAYQEPLPSDEALWTAGNIIITSHSSAHSQGSSDRSYALFAENVRRYVSGLPLLNVVDKKRGY